MYHQFDTLDELFAHIKEDKEWTDAESGLHNRFPVRFVLFDNFADFNEFILNRPDGIYKHSIETMLDANYPDTFLSYTELSKEIRIFTKKIPANDFVIFPFSEMARFYDNEQNTEFDALIRTIGGSQAPQDAQEEHVRVYIPIVGMQGKMSKFINDNQIFVWEYKSNSDKGIYNLIVTDGTTYGVGGLEDKYTVARNLYEWLQLWQQGEGVRQTIICSSPNIFANYKHAQPDNAFTYLRCENAYRFLVDGLHLDFGTQGEPDEAELPFWGQLASMIDVRTFNFEKFVKERFDTFSLHGGEDFIKSWFDCETSFDRWLLTVYFRKITDKRSYIYRAVAHCTNLNKSELFSNIATAIFDEPHTESDIAERLRAMTIAAEAGVKITEAAKRKLFERLTDIAGDAGRGGCCSAAKYLTPLTDEERQLAIAWVAENHISVESIKEVFPRLYYYLQPMGLNALSAENKWIQNYFDAYRRSKLSDEIGKEVVEIIREKNADTVAFRNWYECFKTVKTVLYNRRDIEVHYWIDGLGIEWLPFIREIISQYEKENIYLNEVSVAVADIPTTTANNRGILQSLLPEGMSLHKIGDLDTFAHSAKAHPQYITEEMEVVERAIRKVLDEYNGKKIAFVSDHGITYLAQKESGLNLAGITPNHEGRLAEVADSAMVADNNYIILDDKKTICALSHKSLASKIDKGHGAHGGCTPEEVLVPIVVVSSQKSSNTLSVGLESDELSGTAPFLRFVIKGLSSVDVPTLLYNDKRYNLVHIEGDKFQSERINIANSATVATLCVNNSTIQSFNIKIFTGVEEEDLFL